MYRGKPRCSDVSVAIHTHKHTYTIDTRTLENPAVAEVSMCENPAVAVGIRRG